MLLTGVLASLKQRSWRHRDLGDWPHFPLKQSQDRGADLSSLIIPLCSWRRIAPEQYFTAAGLGTMSTSANFFFLRAFGNFTVVWELRRWSPVNHLSSSGEGENPRSSCPENTQRERRGGTAQAACRRNKIAEVRLDLREILSTTQRKAVGVLFGECKCLRGMSVAWHEGRAPELLRPFVRRNTLDSLR